MPAMRSVFRTPFFVLGALPSADHEMVRASGCTVVLLAFITGQGAAEVKLWRDAIWLLVTAMHLLPRVMVEVLHRAVAMAASGMLKSRCTGSSLV